MYFWPYFWNAIQAVHTFSIVLSALSLYCSLAVCLSMCSRWCIVDIGRAVVWHGYRRAVQIVSIGNNMKVAKNGKWKVVARGMGIEKKEGAGVGVQWHNNNGKHKHYNGKKRYPLCGLLSLMLFFFFIFSSFLFACYTGIVFYMETVLLLLLLSLPCRLV